MAGFAHYACRVTPEELEGQIETLDLINIEVTASLASQSDDSAKIDTKAVVLVGYAGAAATFLATLHAQVQPVLAALAYAAFAMAAGFGIGVFAVSRFAIVPKPRGLFEGYAAGSKAEALVFLAASKAKAYESNDARQKKKARRWRTSLAALGCGIPLMVVSIIVHTGHHV